MITFDDVHFGYTQHKPLFKNLSLELTPGHIYGLLGKNGEGKSTLLRNIAGLLFPRKGELSVFGFKPAKRQAEFLQDVFYIPEEPYLPSCTVKNYSNKFGLLYPKFNREQFDEAISRFSISHQDRLDSISYGQRKKASIAFALACNTNVLLMDEPTNGLDIPSKNEFRKQVVSAFNEERIMIMATHQVRDLENVIDSIVILHDNEIALHASTDEISQLLSMRTCADFSDEDQVLYAQNSPGGFKIVTKNVFGSDNPIDLEYLFNAVIESPMIIKQLFGPLSKRNQN
jgi:ABC-2 type transport system ATP-binding protein